MLHRLYQWMLAKAAHPYAEAWLFAFAFMESSFFPIPPHPLLGLMCLARPKRALRYGAICTAASVIGGLFGYAIGHFLFESVGQVVLNTLGLAKSFPVAACHLRANAALIIIGKGATPIPFKLVTLTSGFIGVPIFTFLWASILSRGFQFMLVGVLFWKFGAPIKAFLDKYLVWASIAFVVAVIGGFLAVGALTGGHKGGDVCAATPALTAPAPQTPAH